MQLLCSSCGIVFLERRRYDELFASHEAERHTQIDDRDERRVPGALSILHLEIDRTDTRLKDKSVPSRLSFSLGPKYLAADLSPIFLETKLKRGVSWVDDNRYEGLVSHQQC